jgi:elongation of very long chain fatty acids protein 4
MSSLQALYRSIQEIVPDERTMNWPMMDFKLMAITITAYVLIVVIGKEIMKNFAPFELKFLRIVHNGLLTLANLYICVELIRQAALTQWIGPLVRGPEGLGLASVLYWYYLSKYWEFMDTFIMVLRKSNQQISFLHVYHHSSVTVIWWCNMYYYPGGEAWPSAFLNSFVHVWMYFYYFLATMNIYPSWKKYLTQLQISQLFFFCIQGVLIFSFCHKDLRFIGVLNGIYAFSVLLLFVNFYKKSYAESSSKKNLKEASKEKSN